MLTFADGIVIFGYLAVVATVGLLAGRGQRTTRDYFLGAKSIPWWAAGISILATETSTLTFIGAPVQSLRGDWTYVQLTLGSALGRLAVAGILIGVYYRADITTVYGYLAERFGPWSRNLSTVLFLVGRLLGSGVRLYASAIALVVITGVSFPLAILVLSAVAVAYTLLGGLRSIVWTDVLQGSLLIGGALLALVYLARSEPGLAASLAELRAATTPAGNPKLRFLDFSLDPRTAYTIFAGLIGSAFLTMSTHGTDQDMIQRALACREAKDGRRSMWLSAVLTLPVTIAFLAIGSLLWVQLGGDAGAEELAHSLASSNGFSDPGRGYEFLFPFYVVQTFPPLVRGLILAALFATAMSSLDSAIGALATTAVENLWRPYVRPNSTEKHYLAVARWLTMIFGLALVAVALVVWLREGSGGEREGFGVLMLGLKVLSWIFPPLLGVFLVGVLTRRGSDLGNVIAISTGVGTLLFVEAWPAFFGVPPPFAWTWNPVLGCAMTFTIAVAFPPRHGSTMTTPAVPAP
ncbi:MAG TPA: sodium/solute symporter [Thermoanaerobaculia bacterium]|nr:sodium/solute symporter [Thermoanaerobaculia bacterium]